MTNNAKDFEPLHETHDHAGVLLYYDQTLPDTDPEGLARTIDEVFDQYGTAGVENELVDLGEWYGWLHGYSNNCNCLHTDRTASCDRVCDDLQWLL